MSGNPVIQLHALSKRFRGHRAVNEVSFDVQEGTVFALLGPNGSGKTTTIKMLLNLIRPSAGSAEVLGRDTLCIDSALRAEIGYVSEAQRLPSLLRVGQLLNYLRPMYPRWDTRFCAQLLAQFEIPGKCRIGRLSRGQGVKLRLLCALAYRPRLLFVDELFSGLDPLIREDVTKAIIAQIVDWGGTVFVTSHDILTIEALADHIVLLHQGEGILDEPCDALLNRFRSIAIASGVHLLPDALPANWQSVQHNGQAIRFIDTDFRGPSSISEIQRMLGVAARPMIDTMNLQEIFVHTVRQHRNAGSQTT